VNKVGSEPATGFPTIHRITHLAFSVAAPHSRNSLYRLTLDLVTLYIHTFKNTSKHTCLASHNLKPPAPLYPL